MHAYLGYSLVFMKQRNYYKAIPLLKEGIALSYTKNNAIYRSDLLEKLSECYQESGQLQEALKTYKRYQTEIDSLFNADKERDLSDLRIKYDIEKHENDVKESRLAILEKEKKLQFLIVILVGLIIIASLLYYLYARKNTLYKAIVRQHQEAIKREDLLKRHALAEETVTHEKYSVSSLSSEKSQVLFSQLEKVMRQDKAYSDNMLTKEKLADVLGTNRTYLSQVINEQAGVAFTQYLNNFRIDEAIRQLSDPSNDIPLKALSADLGFNSMTTFYTLFNKSVGMTPAQFRKQVKQLENN
jgi:YesN/AraC family two-component response regulator